jgi:hypothetical protein
MNDRDPEFAAKAVAIIDLLLSPPTDGPLFCVDEKPGIGVRAPTVPDQPAAPTFGSRACSASSLEMWTTSDFGSLPVPVFRPDTAHSVACCRSIWRGSAAGSAGSVWSW